MEGENSSGLLWPQRNYTCSFCKRQFNSAQALGGHMNVHRRDRAMLIQLPSWVFDHQCPNPNSNSISKSHPNPNFSSSSSSTISSSSPTTAAAAATLLPHRHYTHQYHPFHLSPSPAPSGFTAASFSSSSYQGMKSTSHFESSIPLYEDLTKKNNSNKDHLAKKYHEIEVLKQSELISLDLEIGCKDSKEALDLELRLGCF